MKKNKNSRTPVAEAFGSTVGIAYQKSLRGKKGTFTEHLNASEDALNEGAKGFCLGPGKTNSRPTRGKYMPA